MVVAYLAYPGLPDTPAVLSRLSQPVDIVSICAIQGTGGISPFVTQIVRSAGIVYADFEPNPGRGFYMQQPGCDNDNATSDGIFVYLGESADLVHQGDYVEVTGLVQEYGGQTEIRASASGIAVLSSGNSLPDTVELNPPLDVQAANAVLEALEGMYVRLDDAVVVGPTDDAEQTWVVNSKLGIERVYQEDLHRQGAVICIAEGGHYKVVPDVKTGDHILGIFGALDGTDEYFQLQLLFPVGVQQESMPEISAVKPISNSLTVATINLANLFDSFDDPTTDDRVVPAAEYQRRLEKHALTIHSMLAEPDILVLQEAENQQVLQALTNQTQIEAEYEIVWQDSVDQRGLDTALMFRQDRLTLVGYQIRQGCTDLIDGLGPDGNGDVDTPTNLLTCDLDGDGNLEGNRLFSRPPLVVRLRIANTNCLGFGNQEGIELIVIVNHLKSKVEDSSEMPYTLSRRNLQANFLAALVKEQASDMGNPYIIVAGDMNDFPDSEPIAILRAAGLRDLTEQVVKDQRYTYNYRGVSQTLDYILDVPDPRFGTALVKPMHINADYPTVFSGIAGTVYRSSDHDPLWADFVFLTDFIYLPIVQKTH